MFTGVTFEKAIEYWRKGKEVIVLDRNSKSQTGSGYDTFDFSEMFANLDFLVDVPAVPDLEFEAAVHVMERQESTSSVERKSPPQCRN